MVAVYYNQPFYYKQTFLITMPEYEVAEFEAIFNWKSVIS